MAQLLHPPPLPTTGVMSGVQYWKVGRGQCLKPSWQVLQSTQPGSLLFHQVAPQFAPQGPSKAECTPCRSSSRRKSPCQYWESNMGLLHGRQQCYHQAKETTSSLTMQLLWSLLGVAFLASCVAAEGYRVVCYYGSWAVYCPGEGKFDVEDIDPTLCTHLVYTFENVNLEGSVIIYDSWNDIDKGALKRFVKLREKSPSTKIMVAIGGWNAGSYTFSQVVNSPTLRAKFADSIVEFVLKWGFDGFDVDWEYPAQRGGQASDKEALIELLKLLRPKFDEHKLILSAALSAGVTSVDTSYDVPGLNKYLDFLNVMAYDLHGSWETFTGENAPLYAGPADQSELQKTLNVDYAVKYWIKKGATPSKINLGMGTYGRSFSLASATKNGVGAQTYGPGEAGPYTREGGTLGYNEICDYVKSGKWTEHWNEPQQVPYATSGTQWVGYDNIKSIKLKAQYVKDHGLGGAMIWSVETDDFHGKCGNGKNPLLNAIKAELTGDMPNPPPTQEPSHTTAHSGDHTQPPKTEPPKTEPPVTEPPVTQPPPPPKGICTKNGFVRDPNNCAVFYNCVTVDGGYQAYRYECASGTVFDPSIDACNFQTSVKC